MSFQTLIDNEARRVIDVRLPEPSAGPCNSEHTTAHHIGMDDGTGYAVAVNGGVPRYLPIARGRVDWLGGGQLEVHAGRGAFGRAVLVEVRALPSASVARTFGDRVLHRTDGL